MGERRPSGDSPRHAPDGTPLSAEQSAVLDLIESTRDHVFVTGRAGTGKSTLLETFIVSTDRSVMVCAPTGVAALNVGGQTIHSLFRLPIGLIADHDLDDPPAELRRMLATVDTIVIDEVSMVSADLMDAIDRRLRQARARPAEPFGGAQVVMFGDPYQLAPVPGRDEGERAYYADHYRSIWFFDARVWQQADLRIVELQAIHRQHDADFRAMLTAVRHGTVTPEIGWALNEAGQRPAPEGTLTLATTNATVTRINADALRRLPGEPKTARADIAGEFGPRGGYPADEELQLKIGAQVMFLRNDTGGEGVPRWVNGTLGTVERIGRTVHVAVDGESHEVLPATWEKYRYTYSSATKRLSKDVVAEFTQFPLRLAWAVTIHKSQGSTYDRAIIDLGPRAFAPGQTYVALSRLRSLDGLHLVRPLRPSDVIVDDDVRRFMAEAEPGIGRAALDRAGSQSV